MGEIIISVIVPVYNAQEHITRCLDSISSQTVSALEVICVDDGSADNSAALIEQAALCDSRIRLIKQENRHAGEARNNGIGNANGEYIAFLDADDIYYTDRALELLLRKAMETGADMVKGSFRYLDENGRIFSDCFSRNSSAGFSRHKTVRFCDRPERFIHAADVPWNGLYRKAFLDEENIRFNNLLCVNDHSFYINCLVKAKKICFTSVCTVLYTIHREGSLVSRKRERFMPQISSYGIVRGICRELPREQFQTVMRQELMGVFGLYEALDEQGKKQCAQPLCEFLRGLDENDVGTEYLEHFSFAQQYFLLRHGKTVSRRQYPTAKKLLTLIGEHGFVSTAEMLTKRIRGKK